MSRTPPLFQEIAVPFTVECSTDAGFAHFAPEGELPIDTEMMVCFAVVEEHRAERSTGHPRTFVADIPEIWVYAGVAEVAHPNGREKWPGRIWRRLTGEPFTRAFAFIEKHHASACHDTACDQFAPDEECAVSLF